MKRPAWEDAGASIGVVEEYHSLETPHAALYLEVPAGLTGLAAAIEFDQCAVAAGHASFIRRVIPGEFAPHIGGVTDGDRRWRLTEIGVLWASAYGGRKIAEIRRRGLFPAVKVTSLRPRLRVREIVALAAPPPALVDA